MNALLGNHGQFAAAQQAIFNPTELFGANEQGLILDPFLSEAARTWRRNLLTFSDMYSDSLWTKNNGTISVNTTIAHDGTLTADTLTQTTGTILAFLNRAVSFFVLRATYTFSVYAKFSVGRRHLMLEERGSTGTAARSYFNIETGVVSFQDASHVATIENAGNGWYRCSIRFTVGSLASPTIFIGAADAAGSINVPADGGSMLIGGSQLELGSSPTIYQRITDFATEFKAAFPLHKMYVDAYGDTPAVAPGDSVGLVLDQSKNDLNSLGSNLIESTLTGWNNTDPTNIMFSGGTINFNVASGSQLVEKGYLTLGRFYLITFNVTRVSGSLNCRVGVTTYKNVTATQAVQCVIHSTTATDVDFQTSGGFVGSVSNIVVREIPGNHAYQTTSGARPTLARRPFSGRRNLLTWSEQFDNAGWGKQGITVTANSEPAPNSTQTGDTILTTVGVANPGVFQTVSYVNGQQYTFSVWLKAGTSSTCRLSAWGPGVGVFALVDVNLTSDWTRFVFTYTANVTTTAGLISISPEGFIVGTGKSVLVWGAQLETGNTATNYQRVDSTHDVTEAGQPDIWALSFDGADDHLLTNAINFTGTDEMTVIAGARKLVDSSVGMVVELSTDTGANNGTFYLLAGPPSGTGPRWTFATKGTTVQATQSPADYAAPITNVISGQGEISDDISRTRINGAQVAEILTDQGTGNYGNYAIYIGRRGGTALPFNGLLHHLIIRGRATTGSKLIEAEKFSGRKAGLII